MPMPVETIISGGQTGVDRAALDVALALGLRHGGWCPAGRRAEDGRIPGHYQLRETPSADYLQRTEWNVRDSDATLILSPEPLEGGTAATRQFARRYARPCLVLDPWRSPAVADFLRWLETHDIRALNVAGPRESKRPGIYRQAVPCLRALLAEQ